MGTPKKIPQLPQKTTAINNDDKYIIEDSADNKTKFIRAQDMLSYFGGSGIQGGANDGAGSKVFKNVVANLMRFRTLLGGGATTVTESADEITISTPPATGTNLGSGQGVYAGATNNQLSFKSLLATGLSTINSTANEIAINTATPNLNQVLTQGNNANNQQIINLGTPTNFTDAANKKYIDERISVFQSPIQPRTKQIIDKWISDRFGGVAPNEFFYSFNDSTGPGASWQPANGIAVYLFYFPIRTTSITINKFILYTTAQAIPNTANVQFAIYTAHPQYWFSTMTRVALSDVFSMTANATATVVLTNSSDIVINNATNGLWIVMKFTNVATNFFIWRNGMTYSQYHGIFLRSTDFNTATQIMTIATRVVSSDPNDVTLPSTIAGLDTRTNFIAPMEITAGTPTPRFGINIKNITLL